MQTTIRLFKKSTTFLVGMSHLSLLNQKFETEIFHDKRKNDDNFTRIFINQKVVQFYVTSYYLGLAYILQTNGFSLKIRFQARTW